MAAKHVALCSVAARAQLFTEESLLCLTFFSPRGRVAASSTSGGWRELRKALREMACKLLPPGGVIRLLCCLALVLATSTPAPRVAFFHRPIVKVGANQSNNWSGYNQGTLEKGGVQFHRVSGTWVVPAATQHVRGEGEFSASWIGIGGGCVDAGCTVTDATLIQAGTSQNVDANGTECYDAWWELIPAPSVTIANFPVSAGNTIHADIAEGLPGVWTITVQNLSTGRTFTQTLPYTSTYATAEWIEETPVVISDNGAVTVGPMPNLSVVGFSAASVNGAGAASTAAEAIQLVGSNGAVLATPSAPGPSGSGFNVCTYASTCPAP
jgi:hypothetical protein